MMNYPTDFPTELQPTVDGALAEAEVEFLDSKKASKNFSYEADMLIASYILKVFKSFAYQACIAQEKGIWTGQRTRSKIEEFLHDIVRYAYLSKSPDPIYSHDIDDFEQRFTNSLRGSNVWRMLQEELQRVAGVRAAQGVIAISSNPSAHPTIAPNVELEKPQPSSPVSRARSTVTSHLAVQRMDAYMESKGEGQTEFAIRAGTTDRTIRTFRKTGKVRRDVFDGIAKAMGVTREDLLKVGLAESNRKVTGK